MAAFAEGVPCWVDGVLPDLEAGKRFYGELFGWTFGPTEPGYGYYTQAFREGRNVAALAPKPDGRMPTVWNLHFATRDAVSAATRIRDAGGQVIMDPTRLGDFGTTLTAVDPGGAVFGVWQAGSHQGFERYGAPGSFGWFEIYTRAPEAVDIFYREVFGYRMEPATDLGDTGFTLWWPGGGSAGERDPIGGRAVIDGSFPAAMPSHFLTYFVVGDCDETLRATERLGGRVLHPAEDTPYGRFAILADNQGTTFAVIVPPAAGDRAATGKGE